MRGGQLPVMILDQMQVLDQQVAPARPVGEQPAHLLERLQIDLATLGGARRPAAAGPVGTGTRWRLHVHRYTPGQPTSRAGRPYGRWNGLKDKILKPVTG